jgi:hypothetical protein
VKQEVELHYGSSLGARGPHSDLAKAWKRYCQMYVALRAIMLHLLAVRS